MSPREAVEHIRDLLRKRGGMEADGVLLDEIEVVIDKVKPPQPAALGGLSPLLPTPQEVIEAVARRCSTDPPTVISHARHRNVALARQISMFIVRTELQLSFPKTASAFGRTDHTTAMSAVKKVRQLMVSDIGVKRLVENVLVDLGHPWDKEEAA